MLYLFPIFIFVYYDMALLCSSDSRLLREVGNLVVRVFEPHSSSLPYVTDSDTKIKFFLYALFPASD